MHQKLKKVPKIEVEEIVNFFEETNQAKRRLVIYSCTSGYPVSANDVALLEINWLYENYESRVNEIGFSGHHLGVALDIAAYTLGARWIERHFTKDRTWKGTDHAASLEPQGLQKLVRDLTVSYQSLQFKDSQILPIEQVHRDKLKNKKIILIIGGGIAAYKSLDLIRLLKKQECEVKVVLTESGKKFVTPLSIASLSQNKVYQDIFDSEKEAEMDHISLSRWCDIILFAPITANSIAKLASGRADDLASTLILASNKQVILAPAMNVRMWLHKSTQNNIDKLLDFGYLSVGPSTGEMACGEYGEG